MTKPCPSCGAETHPGARYCRRCGAPLRASTGDRTDTGEVSPQAATVPLGGDARTTDGLGSDDHQLPTAADTGRVNRTDLDHLLRTQQMTPSSTPRAEDGADGTPTLIQPGRGALADEFARFESSLGRDAEDDSQDTSEIEETQDSAPSVNENGGDFGFKTRASFDREQDEELTVLSPRPSTPGTTYGREPGGGISLEIVDGAEAAPSSSVPPSPPPRAPARRRLWPYVVAACAAGLVLTVAAAWLASNYLRNPAPTSDAGAPTPVEVTPDARQLFDAKLAEAESLLASGQRDEALARLREANEIDPANTRAHRRLGDLLMESGARREAIEEFRAVTQNDPNDFSAWRQLASAQFAEGLQRDAAESYRRLIALVGESAADPTDLLSYADALSRTGRADEARALYQRLASAPNAEIAAAARQRLAELAAQPTPSPSPGQRNAGEQARAGEGGEGETANATQPGVPSTAPTAPTPAPQPTPAPTPVRPAASTPAEHYRRGVELWSSNRAAALNEFRAAGNNPEAQYYLGLGIVEGRDLRSLKRAEIVAALQFFQNAQRGGQFASQARRHAQQLEREFDRLKRQ
ncbi:MAG TPA: tetratricopeptide repeat protein [Pyrinomonadaceae bacterium]|nr:tetratricopeptide repeat protein [Pyrinomonadaceae bacterium]